MKRDDPQYEAAGDIEALSYAAFALTRVHAPSEPDTHEEDVAISYRLRPDAAYADHS